MNRTTTSAGLTLVEMLVVLFILGIVLTVSFNIALSSTQLYGKDKSRLNTLGNVRAGFDLLAMDIREAGELLPSAAPAVQVFDSSVPGAGTIRVLQLRRGLSDVYLPLCGKVSSTTGNATTTLYINKLGNPDNGTVGDGASKLPDACSSMKAASNSWEAIRQARKLAGEGERVRAVLVNILNKTAVSFNFNGVDSNGNLLVSNLTLPSPGFIDTSRLDASTSTGDTRLYLVEERTYWLQDGAIYLDIDGQGGKKAIIRAERFSVTPLVRTSSGSANASLPFGQPLATPNWRDLAGLRVEVSARDGKEIRRATETLLPRNALSRDQ